jgi:hypothetical protein
MAELVALIAGVGVPALHEIRLLTEDIKKIPDAPNTIQDFHRQLNYPHASIASVLDIEQEQWEALGSKVLGQSQATIVYCNKACNELHRLVRRYI